MRLQPNRNYVSNDDIQTPPLLARRLVRHFRPQGRILEPCKGAGNFLKHLPKSAEWCELKEGRDFFAWTQKVDWIITNPPWSQMRRFLQQAMSVADHVVFLLTLNHLWTRARLRDIKAAGFGLREIVLLDLPPSFPPMGFQLGAVHLSRGWTQAITLTDWTAGGRS
jgi:hypothetical protein